MKNRQARYQVGDIIGNTQEQYRVYQVHMGGMGEVYLCLHEQNKLPFALKTFQGTSPNLRGLFEKEVKTWVDLGKHPNIVQCYWMQVLDNTPFMVLEWVAGDEFRGTDLRGWLRYGALDLKQALRFTIDIVRGLVYAGEKSDKPIVHRDLKPDNVLVAQGGLAKITDFGLATIINKANLADETSENDDFDAGNMVGTPAYMPPEQWRGDVDIDPRADMYAVGCMLYEMLTGRMAYVASTISQLRLQHIEAPIPQANSVPTEVNAIISKCLAKNRADRYPTMTALLEALTQFYEAQIGENIPPVQVEEMTAGDYVNRGMTYANLKLYDLALADLDEAIYLNPNLSLASMNRGNIYHTTGEYEQAIADLNKAIHLDPTLAQAYYNRGNIYYATREYERAIADYTEAIHLDPTLAQAYTNRGNRYQDIGEHEQAIADYTEAIHLDPTDSIAYTNRGNSYGDIGKHEQAIADYTEAIHLDPTYAKTYYNRGNIYHAIGEHEQAIADYTEAIHFNLIYIEAYINRGISYRVIGEYKRAIADFDKAIRLDPTFALAYYNRGISYATLGQHERAIADYTEAIRLDPKLATAYSNRGASYEALGQHERAIADYTEAIRLDPKYATAWFNKGVAYGNTRRLQEALACFERAHQLGYPQALGVIQQVKRMMGNATPPPPQNDTQVAFEAFQRATSPEAMRQAVVQYPILKDMIEAVQQVIQTQVPPHLKPEFETRLAWLIQIAKGE